MRRCTSSKVECEPMVLNGIEVAKEDKRGGSRVSQRLFSKWAERCRDRLNLRLFQPMVVHIRKGTGGASISQGRHRHPTRNKNIPSPIIVGSASRKGGSLMQREHSARAD